MSFLFDKLLKKVKRSSSYSPVKKPVEYTSPDKSISKDDVPNDIRHKREKLVWACMEHMANQMIGQRDTTGKYQKQYVRCAFPGTDVHAYLWVEQDLLDDNLCRLSAQIVENGTELGISNYMKKGTETEIKDYLLDKRNINILVAVFLRLSEKVNF